MARPNSSRPLTASVSQPKLDGFVFTEKLGSGTYATVYKAYKKTGARDVVAIKCVLRTSLNKASSENLLTEIELLKKLNHRHIVALKDFLWDDQYIYLIMEYCSGGDLSHFIRSKRALPEHIVKRFLQQIVKAVHYMRSHNVVHMDLKPQNILLSSSTNPSLKIADFGFARHMFQGDELHVMRGSPLYMAPEIICKGIYDARVDIWSIGVILYECLFGRAPFASKNFQELQEKIADSKPVEIKHRRAYIIKAMEAKTSVLVKGALPYGVEVSDECRDLLLQMLKRDPEERISFDDFFNHPFVDLEHMPSNDSLTKAVECVMLAVKKDQEGHYKEAIKLYCDSMSHFIPAIHFEKETQKKEAIRKKVNKLHPRDVKEYMERAEELKNLMKPQKNTVQRSLSNDPIDVLMELSSDCEELKAALKVLRGAEAEQAIEDYNSASRHYELGLRTVIDKLKRLYVRSTAKVIYGRSYSVNTKKVEPKGKRKELLGKQAHIWMDEAEKIKMFLSVQQLNTQDKSVEEEENEAKQLGLYVRSTAKVIYGREKLRKKEKRGKKIGDERHEEAGRGKF